MDKKSLGATLIAATTALGMAGVGCESAEEKAAVESAKAATQVANDAILDIVTMQQAFTLTLEGAVHGSFYSEGNPRFMYTEDGASTDGLSKKSVVLCSNGATHFNTPMGEMVQDLSDGVSCARRVIRRGTVFADTLPMLESEESFGLNSVEVGSGRVKSAKIQNGKAGIAVEALLLDESECIVNGAKVPRNVCSRVFVAVQNALSGMFKAGRETHDRMLTVKTPDSGMGDVEPRGPTFKPGGGVDN